MVVFGKRKGTNLACDVSDSEFLDAWRNIYNSDIPDDPPQTCNFKLTTEDIVEQIQKTKTKRAPGNDGIHNSITKADMVSSARWIKRIYKQACERGGFPEEFCAAKVILIPKGAITKLHDPLGVRPIALLTSWYKIIDGVLNNKIKEILDPQISRR